MNKWITQGNGNYVLDFKLGQGCGQRYVRALRAGAVTPFLLSDIVEQMPEPLTAVEFGFLSEICRAVL